MSDAGETTLLVSPAEPATLKAMLGEHEVSVLPERFGCDFMWRERGTWWGVQRKTVSDLIASIEDGRLVREVPQMATKVSMPVLLVEGRMEFTTEGQLMKQWGQRITATQWRGVRWTLASKGITVDHVATMGETVRYVEQLMRWTAKATHTSLTARPKAVDSAWGKPNNRDWGVFMLQSFDGVGAGVAGAIFDHFGRVPMSFDVTREELLEVKGLGPTRVDRMLEVLG
jgi:DNA excision repair protein ERCC-4